MKGVHAESIAHGNLKSTLEASPSNTFIGNALLSLPDEVAMVATDSAAVAGFLYPLTEDSSFLLPNAQAVKHTSAKTAMVTCTSQVEYLTFSTFAFECGSASIEAFEKCLLLADALALNSPLTRLERISLGIFFDF